VDEDLGGRRLPTAVDPTPRRAHHQAIIEPHARLYYGAVVGETGPDLGVNGEKTYRILIR